MESWCDKCNTWGIGVYGSQGLKQAFKKSIIFQKTTLFGGTIQIIEDHIQEGTKHTRTTCVYTYTDIYGVIFVLQYTITCNSYKFYKQISTVDLDD